MGDRFGNTAVAGRDARESGGHRFQQAVRNTFSIAIRCLFARMQKKVAVSVKGQQSLDCATNPVNSILPSSREIRRQFFQ